MVPCFLGELSAERSQMDAALIADVSNADPMASRLFVEPYGRAWSQGSIVELCRSSGPQAPPGGHVCQNASCVLLLGHGVREVVAAACVMFDYPPLTKRAN